MSMWAGFWQSPEVHGALALGAVVAAVSGVIGVFVVLRGQSFAGHALADIGGAGAAGAFLAGVNSLWGFLLFGLLGAVGVELLGRRARERDLATGIVLALALGVEALLLYFDTRLAGGAQAPMLVLFGSVFVVAPSTVRVVAVLSLVTAAVTGALYRPLLLCSIEPELAVTRGIPVTLVSLVFILLLAVVVEEGSLVVGALLSTGLLIGPAAAAVRLTAKTGWAMFWAALLGVAAVWAGVFLAYGSYRWPPGGHGWPVSFFTAALILVFYLAARLGTGSRQGA